MNDLKICYSIMKQKQELKNIIQSIFVPWNEYEWLLTSMCQRLDGTWIYTLVEYCEKMEYNSMGIFNIAVTEDELKQYFYEDRKRD